MAYDLQYFQIHNNVVYDRHTYWYGAFMKKIMTLAVILAISLPLWAMRPVEDSELSNVTGLNSLSMATPERGRLNIRYPLLDAYGTIELPLMIEAQEFFETILYGSGEDKAVLLAGLSGSRMYSTPHDYRKGYITTEELQNDQATGRDDPLDIPVVLTDYHFSMDEPIGSGHTQYYTYGSSNKTDTAIYYELKPYGGGEMRDYYIKDTSTVVKPSSWFDVRIR
jgi:hypothetical protein